LGKKDFFDHQIILSRLVRGQLGVLERDRLQVQWPTGKADVLNELLLHRSAASKAIPEFEFWLGKDDFSFPTCIVRKMRASTCSLYSF
jgi:hypothetical protein